MACVADLWSGCFHFCHVSFLETTLLGVLTTSELPSVIVKWMGCPAENDPANTFEAKPSATVLEPSVPTVAPLYRYSQRWPDLQSVQQGLKA